MKSKISILCLFIPWFISAQTVLTYDDHCYRTNENYSYNLVEFASPGEGGAHQVWDFSGVDITETLNGEMNVGKYTLNNEWFPSGNISVEEFGNQFIFESSPNGMNQVGFISADEKTVIRYEKASMKLKFPMHYSDSFTGDLETHNLENGTVHKGNYTVTADAYGTIILPDYTTFENALRVHSLTKIKRNDGSIQESKVYRWYVKSERFPVMVTQEITVKRGSAKVSTTYKSAYNTNVTEVKSAKLGLDFQMQPNPANTNVNMYFSNDTEVPVTIQLFSLDGKLVDNILSANMQKGKQQLNYTINKNKVSAGTYVVKIQQGEIEKTATLIVQQ